MSHRRLGPVQHRKERTMKIRFSIAILSLAVGLACGGLAEGRGFGGSGSRSGYSSAAAAIPRRAPPAARATVATAAEAVRTIDPTKVRTAVRSMPAARAARRTARTVPLPEAPATCLPPARKAKPTTARRNRARQPAPMAPSPAAAAARAPRALTANRTPASAKAAAAAGPYGCRRRWQPQHERHGC